MSNPYKNETALQVLEYVADDPDDLTRVLGMIPAKFAFDDKARYLAFRAVGFTPRQALETIECDEQTLADWYDSDPSFEQFELNHLEELQRVVGTELVRHQFLQNMIRFHFQDAWLLQKSMTPEGLNKMTKREFDALNSRRSFYSASNFNQLQRALDPEKDRGNLRIALQINNGPMYIVEDEAEEEDVKLLEGKTDN